MSADGVVYVTDGSRILLFSGSSLQPIAAWNNFPAGFYPHGDVVVDSRGNLHVVDTLGHRLLRLKANGEVVDTWGDYSISNGQSMSLLSTWRSGPCCSISLATITTTAAF